MVPWSMPYHGTKLDLYFSSTKAVEDSTIVIMDV